MNDMIKLRAPEPEDVDFMYRLENEHEARRWSDTPGQLSRRALERFVENYDGEIAQTGQLRYIACADSCRVAVVDLFDYDAVNMRAAVGIAVAEEHRGEGYGSQCLEALAEEARTRLGLYQLYALVSEENVASQKLFLSAGWEETARLAGWLRQNGRFVDAIVYRCVL